MVKEVSETFKQNPQKIHKVEFIFSKVATSKNEFMYFFKVFAESLTDLFMTFGRTVSVNQNCY